MAGRSKKDQMIKKYEIIRQVLEEQREGLLAEAGEIIGGNLSAENGNIPDLGDQASVEANQNFIFRLREREQKLLKKIDEALDRMQKGIYGVCESCEEEIGVKRLQARPVTTLCIDCKTEQEEEEKIRK